MTESRVAAPVRVLVAESEAALKKEIAEALTLKGFTVELSENAEDAFDKVRVFLPNIILYDLDLPGYGGLEAITLISKMRSGKESFLAALSSRQADEVAAAALQAGAWAFVSKPGPTREVLQLAGAIKRHLGRPRELPRAAQAPAFKVVAAKCARPGCQAQMVSIVPKVELQGGKADQFETTVYYPKSDDEPFYDYNLASISVCPECYWAFDTGAKPSAVPQAFAAEPALFRVAAAADDTLLSDMRTPESALVAYKLAIESERVALEAGDAGRITSFADLLLKAAAVAHRAGDERERDKFFAQAERVCASALALEPCGAVYRAAYRLVAIYMFFMRDLDAARIYKRFDVLEKPPVGRMKPRDSRILANCRAAAANLIAAKNNYRRANYLTAPK